MIPYQNHIGGAALVAGIFYALSVMIKKGAVGEAQAKQLVEQGPWDCVVCDNQGTDGLTLALSNATGSWQVTFTARHPVTQAYSHRWRVLGGKPDLARVSFYIDTSHHELRGNTADPEYYLSIESLPPPPVMDYPLHTA